MGGPIQPSTAQAVEWELVPYSFHNLDKLWNEYLAALPSGEAHLKLADLSARHARIRRCEVCGSPLQSD